jgi:hypothetical protein
MNYQVLCDKISTVCFIPCSISFFLLCLDGVNNMIKNLEFQGGEHLGLFGKVLELLQGLVGLCAPPLIFLVTFEFTNWCAVVSMENTFTILEAFTGPGGGQAGGPS